MVANGGRDRRLGVEEAQREEHIRSATDSAYVQDRLKISDVAALRAIETLEKAAVLVQPASAKKNRVWQSPEILSALDAFADRIHRVRGYIHLTRGTRRMRQISVVTVGLVYRRPRHQ